MEEDEAKVVFEDGVLEPVQKSFAGSFSEESYKIFGRNVKNKQQTITLLVVFVVTAFLIIAWLFLRTDAPNPLTEQEVQQAVQHQQGVQRSSSQ